MYFLLSIFLFSTSSPAFSAGFIHEGMFQNFLPQSGEALSDMSKESKICKHIYKDFRNEQCILLAINLDGGWYQIFGIKFILSLF
jgi:uncharacterized membrane protein YbaN (DUF454 family)